MIESIIQGGVYTLIGNSFKVTFPRVSLKTKPNRVSHHRRPLKRDELMLQFVRNNPDASFQQIADEFGVSVSTAWRFVQAMRKEGKLW